MGCPTGKTEYGSERRANRALRHPKLQTQGRMHAYKCDACPMWHLGHATYIGGAWVEKPPATGLKRPRDVFTGFIVVGQNQLVFGNVCLSCSTTHPVDAERPTLSDLDLPHDFLIEVWQAGDERIAQTLLEATPEQLEQIRNAWTRHHGGHA